MCEIVVCNTSSAKSLFYKLLKIYSSVQEVKPPANHAANAPTTKCNKHTIIPMRSNKNVNERIISH